MLEEIVPSLYRTEIPLPNNPLKWLNAYIVKGGDRFLIIDTGFNREECLNAMNASLRKLDVDLMKTDFKADLYPAGRQTEALGEDSGRIRCQWLSRRRRPEFIDESSGSKIQLETGDGI